jgi:prepilin-type N-terminal cleavage/methylation domain-containing protein
MRPDPETQHEPVETRRGDGGFSLMELMVVVLVIAILIAVIVPTFFSARNRADDRAAQSSLRHALIAAKAMYSDTSSYAAADESSTGLATVEPNLTYIAHAVSSNGPKSVSVNAGAASWSAAVRSNSSKCYWIKEVGTAGIVYGGNVNSPGTCSGDDAAAAAGTSFP